MLRSSSLFLFFCKQNTSDKINTKSENFADFNRYIIRRRKKLYGILHLLYVRRLVYFAGAFEPDGKNIRKRPAPTNLWTQHQFLPAKSHRLRRIEWAITPSTNPHSQAKVASYNTLMAILWENFRSFPSGSWGKQNTLLHTHTHTWRDVHEPPFMAPPWIWVEPRARLKGCNLLLLFSVFCYCCEKVCWHGACWDGWHCVCGM